MMACVGRTAIFPQLPNGKGYPEAGVPIKHLMGNGMT